MYNIIRIMMFSCTAKCYNPGVVIIADLIIDGFEDPALEGENITFTCNNGLILVGPNSSTCMGNGEWEPDPREVNCTGASCYLVHYYHSVLGKCPWALKRNSLCWPGMHTQDVNCIHLYGGCYTHPWNLVHGRIPRSGRLARTLRYYYLLMQQEQL